MWSLASLLVPAVVVSRCALPTAVGVMDLQIHRVGGDDVPVLVSPRGPAPLLRVHDACMTSEVFYSTLCDCDTQLRASMARVHAEGGAVVYLPQEGRGIGLANKVHAYDLQRRRGVDTYEANRLLGLPEDARSYEAVPAVLRALNVSEVTLLTDNVLKAARLREAGVRVRATAPVHGHCSNEAYMRAKSRYAIGPATGATTATRMRVAAELRRGRPVIVTDDADREDEGDLILAAEHATAEWMGFLVAHGTGIVCVATTAARCEELGLAQMVDDNEDPHATAFTVSVDHVDASTGVSAYDRALTCARLATETDPARFRRPGHVFPLRAHPDGLAARRGHTEAGVALCRAAGLAPAAVITEIMAADKLRMARGDELRRFAEAHGLLMTSVAALGAP